MKSSTFLIICSLLISTFAFAQTSTEVFETESQNSPSFTDNGVIFNILTHVGGFDIQANYPGTGWGGTSADNRYIDNSGGGNIATGASFSIKTSSNLFKVNRFWMFLSDTNLNLTVSGTLTVAGKLAGVTKFTQTKSTGFATSLSPTNGYTLIDLTNLNGQNYSNIIIDQLQITLGGAYTYGGLDAFTWVKDTGIVLATNEAATSQKGMSIYPNPTSGPLSIKTEENLQAEIYSQDGKLLKKLDMKTGTNQADISELPNGVYILKTSSGSSKIIKK
ncbi:T9SS type A sorting domain-containing protein [Chryseobacterium sp. RP-3-3]|uniref:T9SS type A sorting domain-containing protein n=1 Tax=Chryseobacterium antibioticum TaxID=2728847 RepID=A0A7Y0FS40_9FLAO|nr:T9SS type A sorting domain-containing protein [Chryseobacterium antibioticum]NML70261.1 T9SS type A sorting domain-containing protein [Chryseobacterium antibioticum]